MPPPIVRPTAYRLTPLLQSKASTTAAAVIAFSYLQGARAMSTAYHRLHGKNVFITGASSGIGWACAERFAQAGSNVIISARRLEQLQQLETKLIADSPTSLVHTGQLDVTCKESVDTFVASIPSKLKPIDILVCNAGLVLGLDKLLDVNPQHMDTMIDTNIKGLVYCIQTLLPQMLQAGGHIVNIGSIAGREPYAKGSIYCATKHAVHAITQSLRCELIDTPVKVTEICPGMVETEFSKVRFHGDELAAKNVYKGIDPLVADDIADLVVFATSRPKHVEIADMVVFPHGQATATLSHRRTA
ncbi:hypothetical protein EV182_002504 [Spiromyces aspiralis]|uniref:Uncharacterized protein n=1 Tax=Spiromyces aspiralis TaxID=68401 RepID=A0ACC1HHX8_9FUNG|nr:hypothetical protein EV182_002504 [Spiromyces aspiralis]